MVLGIKVIFQFRKPSFNFFEHLLHDIIDVIVAKLIKKVVELFNILIAGIGSTHFHFAFVAGAFDEGKSDLRVFVDVLTQFNYTCQLQVQHVRDLSHALAEVTEQVKSVKHFRGRVFVILVERVELFSDASGDISLFLAVGCDEGESFNQVLDSPLDSSYQIIILLSCIDDDLS